MALHKITMTAIQRAIEAAGPNGEAVAEVLLQDIGRPLPPKQPPAADAPFGSYHTQPAAMKNAAVEGATVPETVPDTGEPDND